MRACSRGSANALSLTPRSGFICMLNCTGCFFVAVSDTSCRKRWLGWHSSSAMAPSAICMRTHLSVSGATISTVCGMGWGWGACALEIGDGAVKRQRVRASSACTLRPKGQGKRSVCAMLLLVSSARRRGLPPGGDQMRCSRRESA
jgi:hypothetical protein